MCACARSKNGHLTQASLTSRLAADGEVFIDSQEAGLTAAW